MNKRSMELLERAFCAEIEAGFSQMDGLMQTKSKLAKKLVDEGYLVEDKCTFSGALAVVVSGYRLTHLGRLTYCMTCKESA